MKKVKLLGGNIDHKLRFDHHISKLCSNAEMQLDALGTKLLSQKLKGIRETITFLEITPKIYISEKLIELCF